MTNAVGALHRRFCASYMTKVLIVLDAINTNAQDNQAKCRMATIAHYEHVLCVFRGGVGKQSCGYRGTTYTPPNIHSRRSELRE